MTDTPSDPSDANATARFDPPEPAAPMVPPLATPPPPPISPSTQPPPSAPAPRWRRGGENPGRVGTIVLGVILLAIGLWFFADQTLGLEMPSLRWSQLWPVLLIGLGVWIAVGSMRRR